MSASLTAPVARLAAELAGLSGAVAVVLGGSRATGTHRPDSDWDLGLYYRGAFEPEGLRRLGHEGHVSALGEWGPIMNGGAWLSLDGTPVDVLFRDLDRVEGWLADARQGRYDVLTQNGYVVGAPTYLPVGELSLCRPIAGELPRPEFPDALAETAPVRWRGRASVCLMFARSHTDTVASTGMLAQAALCVAHARLAERREWVLNEKRLIERSGLDAVGPLIGSGDVEAIAELLGVEPLAAR